MWSKVSHIRKMVPWSQHGWCMCICLAMQTWHDIRNSADGNIAHLTNMRQQFRVVYLMTTFGHVSDCPIIGTLCVGIGPNQHDDFPWHYVGAQHWVDTECYNIELIIVRGHTRQYQIYNTTNVCVADCAIPFHDQDVPRNRSDLTFEKVCRHANCFGISYRIIFMIFQIACM